MNQFQSSFASIVAISAALCRYFKAISLVGILLQQGLQAQRVTACIKCRFCIVRQYVNTAVTLKLSSKETRYILINIHGSHGSEYRDCLHTESFLSGSCRVFSAYSHNIGHQDKWPELHIPCLFEWAPNLELAPTSNKCSSLRQKKLISAQPRISAHPPPTQTHISAHRPSPSHPKELNKY